MTYYLIFRENQLRLIPVRPEHEELFCQHNAHRIPASGESPLEALKAPDALPLIFCGGPGPSLFICNKHCAINRSSAILLRDAGLNPPDGAGGWCC
jgi:hypothetical protein